MEGKKLSGIFIVIFALCCAGKASFLQKRGEPPVLINIAELDECQTEIENFCKEKKSNNFQLLTCLHDNVPVSFFAIFIQILIN